MATYWTKCGREFAKSSKAVVTGYRLTETPEDQIEDDQCKACPFVNSVKEGWPQTHKYFECRAGSEQPNHETTYRGRADDKCTMQIDSLNHELLEQIRNFCIEHPELGAGYNADCLADCRRSLSISCSQNRKGMAAKQELLDRFFTAKDAAAAIKSCRTCKHSELFKQVNHAGSAGNCHKNGGNYPIYIPDGSCKDFSEEETPVENGNIDWPLPQKKPRDLVDGVCDAMQEDCPCFCAHNDGCAVKLTTGSALTGMVQEFNKQYDITCAVFRDAAASILKDGEKMSEAPSEMTQDSVFSLPLPSPSAAISFDYSGMDADTCETLKAAEKEIIRVKMQTVYEIGKHLTQANNALAKAGSGSFGAWCEYMGFSRQTAQNHMQAYDFICRNFDRPELANEMQPSLLFAASKPSAPAQLAKAVVDGDITRHKDYQEALARLKKAEDALDAQKTIECDYRKRLEEVERIAAEDREYQKIAHDTRLKEIGELEELLAQTNRDADPAKLEELQDEIAELRQQLKDKPIEVSAVGIREVVPEGMAESWAAAISLAIEQIASLKEDDLTRLVKIVGMQNYAYMKSGTYRDNVLMAASALKGLSDAIIQAPAPADTFIQWASANPD